MYTSLTAERVRSKSSWFSNVGLGGENIKVIMKYLFIAIKHYGSQIGTIGNSTDTSYIVFTIFNGAA